MAGLNGMLHPANSTLTIAKATRSSGAMAPPTNLSRLLGSGFCNAASASTAVVALPRLPDRASSMTVRLLGGSAWPPLASERPGADEWR
jgi:hypothetical protein